MERSEVHTIFHEGYIQRIVELYFPNGNIKLALATEELLRLNIKQN